MTYEQPPAEAAAPDDAAAERKAAAMTADVLAFLGITRVVFVDDRARPAPQISAGDVGAALRDGILDAAALAEQVGATLPAGVVTDDDGTSYDVDVAARNLERWWSDADETSTSVVVGAFRDLVRGHDQGSATDTDAVAVDKVRTLVPRGVEFQAVFPREWDELCATSKVVHPRRKRPAQPKTLVLFDRDLSVETGRRNDEGEQLLASLLTGPDAEHCYGALVSHFVEVEREDPHWREMASSRGLDRTRFTVISKERLASDTLEFARRLRAMLLAPRVWEIADQVANAYVDAVAAARDELLGLSLPALEEAVIGSAVEESLWEPDVLLRLLEAHVRDALRAGLRSSTRLHQLVRELRVATRVRAAGDPPKPGELWRMQRREAYADTGLLSGLRLPLESGDVLRLVGVAGPPGVWLAAGDDEYVIVAEQDCDVHVRRNGKRNRNPVRLAVVPIVTASPTGDRAAVFPLRWFCPATGATAYALLNQQRDVPALALDLAALGHDGYASMTPGAAPPESLIPSWGKRWEVVDAEVRGVLTQYSALTAEVSPDAAGHVLMSLTSATGDTRLEVGVDPTAPTLTFGLQRVSKLLPPWRMDLLQRLSQLRQRVAYEGDLDRGTDSV